ncbi:MAG: serine/threonine-protein kinase [Polyangiaceae bacterium]
MIGRTIEGRYRIDELVAMGGMGAVYRAAHLHMHKAVAIKVLHPEIEGFPELVMRFQREAVAGAHIVHPNVASASDFGTFDDESYYLVLEYIRGVTLSDVMKRGPVPPARAAKIAKQMAAALGAAHAKEIIHRDVKPRNIMLVEGQDDLVKLIDFGLAKVPVGKLVPVAQDEDISRRSLTAAGVVMGTVAYMAPETALGMRAVEPRSDLYAVGVILYEMLAGKHPFDAIEPGLLFAQHRNELPPPLRLRNPDVVVPDALEAVVRNLLEKDPQQRYPDAAAVVTALEEAMPGALAARERAVSQSRDLPVTVIGARSPSLPDTSEAEADAPPPRSSRAPSFSPSRPTDATVRRARPSSVPGRRSARDGAYTPRLLGRPGGDAGGTRGWRIAVGVLALVIVGLAAVIVVQREPELPAAGLGAAPAGPPRRPRPPRRPDPPAPAPAPVRRPPWRRPPSHRSRPPRRRAARPATGCAERSSPPPPAATPPAPQRWSSWPRPTRARSAPRTCSAPRPRWPRPPAPPAATTPTASTSRSPAS